MVLRCAYGLMIPFFQKIYIGGYIQSLNLFVSFFPLCLVIVAHIGLSQALLTSLICSNIRVT